MYTYTHIHMHSHPHMHIHTYTHTYIHTYTHTLIHSHIHLCRYVCVFDWSTGTEWRLPAAHKRRIGSLAFSCDGKYLASAGMCDRSVYFDIYIYIYIYEQTKSSLAYIYICVSLYYIYVYVHSLAACRSQASHWLAGI